MPSSGLATDASYSYEMNAVMDWFQRISVYSDMNKEYRSHRNETRPLSMQQNLARSLKLTGSGTEQLPRAS